MKPLGWRMANLKQHRVSLVAAKGFGHTLPRVLIDVVDPVVGMAIGLVQTETYSTGL